MLQLQEYLRAGNAPETLTEELGINVYRHPTLPLVGFKYSQIDSPKTHPVVRDCRGTVLEDGTWDLIAKPFRRFYNFGEVVEESQTFNWSNFHCNEKADGSLVIVYHYGGEWHANTSGSFGLGEVPFSGLSWRELFWQTAKIDQGILRPRNELDERMTYIFELCTAYNKIVRKYEKPTVYLLSVFAGEEEVSPWVADCWAHALEHDGGANVRRPEEYHFKSRDEIQAFLLGKEEHDKTFEGVIVRDDTNLRFKIKSKTYTALHHLHDNGNLFNPKRLVPLLLAGERDEVVSYFPEGAEAIDRVQADLDCHWTSLRDLWYEHIMVKSQKEFALAVKDHPFAGLLFAVRAKHGRHQTESLLRDEWRANPDRIAKRLYG